MKSLLYLSAFVVLFGMASATSALADGGKTVVVTNSTSYTIGEFYASPSDRSAWDTSDNLIAGQTVGPGQSTTVTIADGQDDCAYDLMAVLYGASQHAYQYQVDTCSGGSWTVSVGD